MHFFSHLEGRFLGFGVLRRSMLALARIRRLFAALFAWRRFPFRRRFGFLSRTWKGWGGLLGWFFPFPLVEGVLWILTRTRRVLFWGKFRPIWGVATCWRRSFAVRARALRLRGPIHRVENGAVTFLRRRWK